MGQSVLVALERVGAPVGGWDSVLGSLAGGGGTMMATIKGGVLSATWQHWGNGWHHDRYIRQVAEGTTMGALAGVIGTAGGVVDDTTMGPLAGAGILGVNLKSAGTANGVAEGTTMGALISAIGTAGRVADGR
jgi:hypothetical protein